MKKRKLLTGLLAGALAICPMMAMAAEVPEVSHEEYRYYLEDYVWNELGRGEYTYYTDEELKTMLNETLQEEEKGYLGVMQEELMLDKNDSSYMRMVQQELILDYGYTAEQMRQYTDDELELLLARNYIDKERLSYKELLRDYYNTDLNIEPYSMLDLAKIYLQVDLQQEYGIDVEFGDMTLFELNDYYDRAILIYALQEAHGTGIDYAEYSLEELRDLYKKDIYSEDLMQSYGVTEDLSVYTGEELELMHDKYVAAKFIKLFHGVDVDVESHTLAELQSLRGRLDAEKSLRGMGVTEDFSRYTNEEVERLCLEENWKRNIGDGRDLSVYTTDTLESLYYEMLLSEATEDLLELKREMEAENAAERAEEAKKLCIRINGELMYLPEDGETYTPIGYAYISDAPVLMKDNRAYLPYEVVFDALGAEVVPDDNADTVTAQKNGVQRVFAQAAGEVLITDTCTYVQLRSAADAFGANVTWTAMPHEINIQY